MKPADALTADLETKTKLFLSLVEEERSPIKNSLSDVPQLRDAYSELRNIFRALDQYSRTNRALRYIGFMGTFSSGKSSIINSLIGQDVRAADLPPVDDEITILTHPTNRDALMGAHSRGLLKVTTQPVNAELLERCFLVDTPGSGDPEVREGMVKDFLPICDLILYVFSATNALSVPDLSILTTLEKRLDFVPIHFVITRSDEFRINHSEPVASNNIDRVRLDQFLGRLIGRIRALAPNLDLSVSKFFFVDNRTKFGIDDLKTAILSELDSDVQLHSKKIAYFRRGISNQKSIFEDYLLQLIQDVSLLDQKAKLNKEKYDKHIALSFQSINDFWRPREGAQTTRVANFQKIIDAWEAVQSAIRVDPTVSCASVPKVANHIEQRSAELFQDLSRQISELVDSELRRRKADLDQQMPDLIKRRGVITPSFLAADHLPRLFNSLAPNVSRAMKSAVELMASQIVGQLVTAARLDQETFSALYDHVGRGDLASKDREYYHDFEAIIRSNLSECLPIVQLFKSAVTSTQARNLIARTGLGERLDVLDSVDVDIIAANDHAQRFIEYVFATRNMKHEALTQSTAALLERRDLVESALSNVRQQIDMEPPAHAQRRSEFAIIDSRVDDVLKPLLNRVLAAVDGEISRVYKQWNDSLEEAQTRFAENLKKNRGVLLRAWLEKFSTIVGIAIFLGILAVGGMFFAGLQDKIGWAWTILSGALTSTTISVLGWGWKRFSSTLTRLLPKTRWRVAKEMADESMPHLDLSSAQRAEQLGKALTIAKDGLVSVISAYVSNEQQECASYDGSIGEAERSLIITEAKEINAYIRDWTNLAIAMNDWYRPDDLKQKLISDAASAIKERAIEPALTLFAGRLTDVRNFSERLKALAI